jgi:hypothetical protein
MRSQWHHNEATRVPISQESDFHFLSGGWNKLSFKKSENCVTAAENYSHQPDKKGSRRPRLGGGSSCDLATGRG